MKQCGVQISHSHEQLLMLEVVATPAARLARATTDGVCAAGFIELAA
jgi:galactose-1-phosphate uridylyltransferase